MAKLIVTYGAPTDADAFDRHYRDVHVGLARALPGLRAFETSRGEVMTPAGPAPAHLIAILTFDDLTAVQAAFGSPQGQAALADAQALATGGVEMVMFEALTL